MRTRDAADAQACMTRCCTACRETTCVLVRAMGHACLPTPFPGAPELDKKAHGALSRTSHVVKRLRLGSFDVGCGARTILWAVFRLPEVHTPTSISSTKAEPEGPDFDKIRSSRAHMPKQHIKHTICPGLWHGSPLNPIRGQYQPQRAQIRPPSELWTNALSGN